VRVSFCTTVVHNTAQNSSESELFWVAGELLAQTYFGALFVKLISETLKYPKFFRTHRTNDSETTKQVRYSSDSFG